MDGSSGYFTIFIVSSGVIYFLIIHVGVSMLWCIKDVGINIPYAENQELSKLPSSVD